ncbi:MAG: hypothetical protein E5Y73_25150 [Mesorhizobium sp.]|uniref:hypothetical protein n=1 Tax=Mesorhizobium sp. TaxID=1871066 RepID=UPI001217E2B7|nr:hypothetical protein [Mesorhizobium sp.]TIL87500.1 MAG: hypothetical protein E5Y73_25150 [Mesorhizobium sp.]
MKKETDLVHNERLKALATMSHNLAVASIAGAVLAPLVLANTGRDPSLGYITTLPFGAVLALAFGTLGQMMLKDLRGSTRLAAIPENPHH